MNFLCLLVYLMTQMHNTNLNILTIEQNEAYQILKTPAANVPFPLHHEDKQLIRAMKKKLYELEGVGLAAPQVNMSKRIIAIYIPENAALLRDNAIPYPMHILINPTYEPINPHDIILDYESCYSVSSLAGKVPRFKKIKVQYQNEEGISQQQIVQGFYARVLQHEIDHVNGLLITDRLTEDCVQGPIPDIMAKRRAELSAEKKILFDELIARKLKK
ncbi:peptide deformylase [Legionella septentrionalis]|uniref:Peptide deformylase n=3 Tax=Legionella TaxID=445 RepID=A0A3S0X2T6_9GAMM|nr:peptide deformylase [Legionella septentrionalis]RUR08730.1 peptide deformylase [Legionella septentrionalis]